jgi:hypothetical protein
MKRLIFFLTLFLLMLLCGTPVIANAHKLTFTQGFASSSRTGEPSKRTSVCVIGATGFLGSRIMHEMSRKGFVVENLSVRSANDVFLHSDALQKDIVVLADQFRQNEKTALSVIDACVSLKPQETLLVNLASDAELLPLPCRAYYGKMKREARLRIDRQNANTMHIYIPYNSKQVGAAIVSQLLKASSAVCVPLTRLQSNTPGINPADTRAHYRNRSQAVEREIRRLVRHYAF